MEIVIYNHFYHLSKQTSGEGKIAFIVGLQLYERISDIESKASYINNLIFLDL